VKYVQNVTDIDDKIIDRANKLGIPYRELADKFTQSYFDDMDALNISKPDVIPYATEEIPKIIEIVQGLVDKGYAYPAQGSVYFRVRNVADYGKLSHRSLESMMSGIQIEASEEKEHPMDFVLWKASKPDEPAWESPWGPGRPGWHIECSAMSLRYLGDTIDIHGGGQDLVFPHHENEIAQSESFTGVKPFVKYWLHNGMVQLGEEKMSKSLGNLITIKEALQKYSADAIRIFALGSHYRSPLTYSEEILEAAERGAERLRQTVNNIVSGHKTDKKIDAEHYRQRLIETMDDDFNTAQAIAVLFDLAREINRYDGKGIEAGEARETLKELGGVMGLTFQERDMMPLDAMPFIEFGRSKIFPKIREAKSDKLFVELEKTFNSQDAGIEDAAFYIKGMLDVRQKLRNEKQFHLADEIRDGLTELGIIMEDTAQGTVWRRKR
jgi:cysteinyl-tRNA synthetase